MKNRMDDLRNHLFETIEGLKDPENPMDIQHAEAIQGVAQTLVNTAKVEVDYIKATGQDGGSGFIESDRPLSSNGQGRMGRDGGTAKQS